MKFRPLVRSDQKCCGPPLGSTLKAVVLNWGWLCPPTPAQETSGNVWEHFCLSQLGDITGILWVETRNATKTPTMHRTTPKTQNYPTPNVNSAKVEKPLEVKGMPLAFPFPLAERYSGAPSWTMWAKARNQGGWSYETGRAAILWTPYTQTAIR